MPSTAVVGAIVLVLAILIALFLLARSRGKAAEPETPAFQPPRELAPRPAKETAKAASEPPKDVLPPPRSVAPAASVAPLPPAASVPPLAKSVPPLAKFEAEEPPKLAEPPAPTFPTSPPAAKEEQKAPTVAKSAPPEELSDDAIVEQEASASPPSHSESRPSTPRPPMRSYSNISDQSVAEEATIAPAPTAPPIPKPSEPKLAKPEPKLPVSEPKLARPEPKPAPSEPKLARPEPRPAPSEPKVAKPAPSEPKVVQGAAPALAPEAATAAKAAPAEHDFSALNESPAAKAKSAAAATAAKFAPPTNPATAELEKNDPRHAAARRLARLSVSEIKLYHEDEVKAGREAKDLWKRLQQDIGLARQTFDARVVAEVRERFDYLYDEIVRQLAEGDASKLGADAPAPKNVATAAAPATTPTAPPPPDAETPAALHADDLDPEAPTQTMGRTLESPEPLSAKAAVADVPKPIAATPVAATPAPASPPIAAVPAAKPVEAAKPAAAPKPVEAAKPSGIAARGLPQNPETAELEKSDPRHAAARRLARLSVSEIKLYHENEVKEGREAKDLWKRMITDIGLATQTFDKRVDKEVRERFDYLYDEILRQLAEGDVSKLGPDAPKPKNAPQAVAAPAPETPQPPAPSPSEPKAQAPSVAAEPKVAPPEPKVAPPEPKVAPSEPKVASVVEAKPATVAAPVAANPAARYLPPSNPATAELEKGDPRHAAARRLARLSVSEIKLYHEDEVKAGREAKDLWKRLITDIGLATQTYEKRVDKEVRERFDYLYDEILRQLAEGDVTKLGADAPKPKVEA